jgi:hypothetical protein
MYREFYKVCIHYSGGRNAINIEIVKHHDFYKFTYSDCKLFLTKIEAQTIISIHEITNSLH